jgi:hypothetical protein
VRARAILSLLLDLYAPLPEPTLRQLARMLPGLRWRRRCALKALDRFRQGPDVRRATIDGLDWLLPAHDESVTMSPRTCGCLRRSTRSCGIAGGSRRSGDGSTGSKRTRRPEKRRLGYYALPLLWRDDVIGWANASMTNGTLTSRRWLRQSGAAPGRIPARARRRTRSDACLSCRDRVVAHIGAR